jgi:hypothetical protein
MEDLHLPEDRHPEAYHHSEDHHNPEDHRRNEKSFCKNLENLHVLSLRRPEIHLNHCSKHHLKFFERLLLHAEREEETVIIFIMFQYVKERRAIVVLYVQREVVYGKVHYFSSSARKSLCVCVCGKRDKIIIIICVAVISWHRGVYIYIYINREREREIPQTHME